MLELQQVRAQYGKLKILQGVDLTVGEGEAVALLGRNGVGKTTTLRTIMGLMPCAGGSIRFDGAELNKLAAHKIPRRGIGYVSQGRGLFHHLTVTENLAIGLPGKPPADLEDHVYERFPRLKERARQKAGTLSGGEQQMLAIARCLVMRPKLLILDEPTEGIMPSLVADIRAEIARINSEGMSILLVEQNVKTALRLCSRIVIMEKGVIVHSGTTQELRQNTDIIHRYLGLSL